MRQERQQKPVSSSRQPPAPNPPKQLPGSQLEEKRPAQNNYRNLSPAETILMPPLPGRLTARCLPPTSFDLPSPARLLALHPLPSVSRLLPIKNSSEMYRKINYRGIKPPPAHPFTRSLALPAQLCKTRVINSLSNPVNLAKPVIYPWPTWHTTMDENNPPQQPNPNPRSSALIRVPFSFLGDHSS